MKTKSLIIALIAVIIITLIPTEAAALSFTASMTTESTTVAESTEFTVKVKVSNIEAGVNGINSLAGYLSYDTKVFDAISESSINALNGWIVSYAAETGKITLYKNLFVKNEEEVFWITFRTKAGTAGKKATIAYKSITASNSETDITATDVSTTITVGNTASPNSVNNITPKNVNVTPVTPVNNVPANKNVVNIAPVVNNAPVNNQPAPVENKASEEVPYTGADDVVVRAIFVVLVIAAISYFKFQSLNDDK